MCYYIIIRSSNGARCHMFNSYVENMFSMIVLSSDITKISLSSISFSNASNTSIIFDFEINQIQPNWTIGEMGNFEWLSRNSRPFESPRDFCKRPRDFCYFQKGREIFVKRPRDFCKRPRDISESQKSLGLFSNSPYFWQKSLGLFEQKSLGLFATHLRLHTSVVISLRWPYLDKTKSNT